MSFDVRNLAVFEVFGVEVWFTETLRNVWIVMGIMIALAIVARVAMMKSMKNATYRDAPKGVQNLLEAIIEIFDRFVRSTAGDRLAYLGHWFFTVFFFILFSNLSGMLIRPPTADYSVTFAMAITTFAMIIVLGFKYRKGAYLKSFFEPVFLFFPLNVIGELAKPISLSFRLFGNILAGMIIMSLLYGIGPIFIRIGIPVFLHAYFDVAMGFLQTYVFVVLSLAFIGGAAGTNAD